MKMFYDRYLKNLKEHLKDGEEITHAIYCTLQQKDSAPRKGIMVTTNKRLLFYTDNFTGFQLEMFHYSNITNFKISKSAWNYTISFAIHDEIVKISGRTSDKDKEFVDHLRDRMSPKKEPRSKQPVQKNAPSGNEVTLSADEEAKLFALKTAKLDKLVEYRRLGVITEEEFTEKKRQLLGL